MLWRVQITPSLSELVDAQDYWVDGGVLVLTGEGGRPIKVFSQDAWLTLEPYVKPEKKDA